MVAMDDVKPWDRQPGETGPAYEAFVTYRDLGYARSTASVAQKLGKSKTLMDRWSGLWNWVERTEAWDSMPGRAVAEAYEEMAADIARQHRELSDKLMKRLSKGLDLMPEGMEPSIKWSTAQAAAHRGHAFAADLSKPADTAKAEISKQIAAIIERLAGGED
jgi:hypothetical protein